MDLLLLKLIVIGIMFLLTGIFGIAPVKLLKYLRKKAALAETSAKQRYVSLFLCLLSCFSGGVFLATCFLHLLPELHEHLNLMSQHYGYEFDYPIAELLSCVGFFLLFFFEELVLRLMPSLGHGHSPSHSHSYNPAAIGTTSCDDEESSCSTALAEPERCETNRDGTKQSPPIFMKRRPHAHSHGIRSVTFVLAISFHSVVEGMALGVQDSSSRVMAIFLSLMVHKFIVSFSIGLQLARTHAHALGWVCLSIILFSAMTPLGAMAGALVQDMRWLNHLTRDWVILIMQGIAVGTFLYVTFFEVLIHERDNEHPNMLKLVAMVIGFALIGSFRIFSGSHDHNGGLHDHDHAVISLLPDGRNSP